MVLRAAGCSSSFMSAAQDYPGFLGSHRTPLTHPELAVKTLSVFTTCASVLLCSFPSGAGADHSTELSHLHAFAPETPWIL